MKRLILIFVLLLPSVSWSALSDDVTVGTPATIATLWSSGQPYLGIPRIKAYVVEGTRLVYMPRASSGDPFALYSDDEGATWDSATGDMGDEDFHTAGFYQEGVGSDAVIAAQSTTGEKPLAAMRSSVLDPGGACCPRWCASSRRTGRGPEWQAGSVSS